MKSRKIKSEQNIICENIKQNLRKIKLIIIGPFYKLLYMTLIELQCCTYLLPITAEWTILDEIKYLQLQHTKLQNVMHPLRL